VLSILLIKKFQRGSDSSKILKSSVIVSFSICIGALLGYCVYGYYCFKLRGDFLAPFYDQKLWDKQLGFYPQLFFIPAPFADFMSIYLPFIALVISWLIFISNNIKKLKFIIPKIWQYILLFAYPPAFIASYGLDLKTANFSTKKTNLKEINLTQASHTIFTSYIFWFCIYFALAHSIIIVFSDQKLTSLRRFIFGTPYFFFVIASISQCFAYRKVSKILLLVLGLSSIGLVLYWVDYGNGLWLG
jgi:hypothetical protein